MLYENTIKTWNDGDVQEVDTLVSYITNYCIRILTRHSGINHMDQCITK